MRKPHKLRAVDISDCDDGFMSYRHGEGQSLHTQLQLYRSSNCSCTREYHTKIHLISPGCPRLSVALQCWFMAFSPMSFIINICCVAVVYLAGHGRYCAGQHYFAPVDPHEGSILDDDYCCEKMQQELLTKKPKVLAMFLDMCRRWGVHWLIDWLTGWRRVLYISRQQVVYWLGDWLITYLFG